MNPEKERKIKGLFAALAILLEWLIVAMFIGIIILLAVCSAAAQCPNDFCETATELSLCEPSSFDNYDCTDEQICISPHPASGSCSYNYQYKSQWFKLVITAAGLYTYIFELATNFTGDIEGWNNCTGMFQGSQWALAKGSCLNWIANSINFNSLHKCFCPGVPFPSGAGAWAGPCWESPCGMIYPLGPYWQQIGLFPQDIGSEPPYSPYVPCKNLHLVELYLEPDTYYIQITSVGLSEGDGTLEVCGPWGPLSTPPKLEVKGIELHWTGETTTVFRVEQLEILTSEWHQIGETTEHHWPLTSGGYYRVLNEYGISNPVHVSPIVKASGGVIYNVLGQEHAKFGVKP